MSKYLDFSEKARLGIKQGVHILSRAVKSTLGPRGRNVILEKEYGEYHSTKDGVTVAKEIELEDTVKNAGAQIVKEVAQQTNDEVGDGTTTATVLASKIITEGFKAIESGAHPIELKKGIDITVKNIARSLEQSSKDVSTADEIKNIATISANNDSEIGLLISEAIDKVGREGVVTVEESQTGDTRLEIVEGMQFESKYLSPYFITNNTDMQVELENPWILLYDKKITSIKDIVKVLEAAIQQDKPLLIIAEDIDGEALAGLIVNKIRGTLKVAAVKAPGFGDRRNQNLEDIASLTGGQVVSYHRGMRLDKITPEVYGTAVRVTINNKNTTIVDGAGTTEEIGERVNQIKYDIDNASSNYDKEQNQERLAKLAGGVAILRIGAESEIEMKEKKDRVEDALNATRAALDEGIVSGGGMILRWIVDNPTAEIKVKTENSDQKLGVEIVKEACREPFNCIMENSGFTPEVIWKEVRDKMASEYAEDDKYDTSWGYDAIKEEVVDMFEAGIIDPAKVTRVALEKAASVAATLLTTECVITKKPEENKESPMMGGGFGIG
ncbi:chaperonin GroEL [Candidatus Pacearchaeota archaeon]|nr:chaperonin GroEL [Candidatus Pacearchaeota archaeon]|tara:strand:+ start:646 stop:2310 length:1665 start_codon:yes stop_codon:yes gene_type:complete